MQDAAEISEELITFCLSNSNKMRANVTLPEEMTNTALPELTADILFVLTAVPFGASVRVIPVENWSVDVSGVCVAFEESCIVSEERLVEA